MVLVMENTWVVLRLKRALVRVRGCRPGNLGHVLDSSALTGCCCLESILLCSDPMELVAKLEEGCRYP